MESSRASKCPEILWASDYRREPSARFVMVQEWRFMVVLVEASELDTQREVEASELYV